MASEGLFAVPMGLNSGPLGVSRGADLNGSVLARGSSICASVMEDMLQGTRSRDVDLASRKAEEAALRRYEASGWLRKMVGVVAARDLPEQPSEEEFRLGLRNGSILCNVLNKIHPGAVSKVVENPVASVPSPDGAALSAYQYFENVRNFLNAIEELRIPLFEASDLEKGGNCARVVNCMLALKSYSDWKQNGGNGSWRYGGNLKSSISGKYNLRLGKNSEPFMNSLSRNMSQLDVMNDKFPETEENSNGNLEMARSHSLSTLVRVVLSDKKSEDVPAVVESMLGKVMEEFERRLAKQSEQLRTAMKDLVASDDTKSLPESKVLAVIATASGDLKTDIEEENTDPKVIATPQSKDQSLEAKTIDKEASKCHLTKQQALFDQQQRNIEELKHTLRTTKAGMQFLQMRYSEEFLNLERHMHGLTSAASGYHKVLEENRKLYNQVQDLKGSIRVYCRVKPFLPRQPNCTSAVDCIGDGSITIVNPLKQGKDSCRSFNFNKVFGPSASQEEVFSDTQPLIRSVLDGYNICIFAYGQTGSGKTHTMTGPKEITGQSQGVNYRALSDLFNISEQRRDTFCYHVSVQMIEIYNEQVRDLLATDGLNKRLEIRNNSQQKGGLNVPDANLVHVVSTSDVIELMNIGQRNRAVGATAINDRSSRSHSCLTVHVQGRDLTSGAVLRGCLHLVDLAGSERVDKSEAVGERLKEAQHINKSLSALGDVIAALAQKNLHIPYRNSKLTQLLQDSLGGQAKTLMFVHISPEVDALGETLSTLKFAERVATVELGAARVNKESRDVRELKEQIASLKAALARKECEPEQLRSTRSSPDRHHIKASGPSPVHSSRQGGGEMLGGHGNHMQSMEEVGNIEAWKNSTRRQRRASFDNQDLSMFTSSPPWTDNSPGINYQKVEGKETGSGNWVDKIMVNKQEPIITDNDPLRCWEGGNAALPDIFYQKVFPDTGIYSDEQHNRKEINGYDIQRNRSETGTTDDSEELEAETSDSSEADLLWQYTPSKIPNPTSGGVSKIPRITKSSDLRHPIHAHGPSRKLTNSSSLPHSGRRLVSGGSDLKRPSSGRMGNGK